MLHPEAPSRILLFPHGLTHTTPFPTLAQPLPQSQQALGLGLGWVGWWVGTLNGWGRWASGPGLRPAMAAGASWPAALDLRRLGQVGRMVGQDSGWLRWGSCGHGWGLGWDKGGGPGISLPKQGAHAPLIDQIPLSPQKGPSLHLLRLEEQWWRLELTGDGNEIHSLTQGRGVVPEQN